MSGTYTTPRNQLWLMSTFFRRSFSNVIMKEILLKSPNSLQAIKKIEDYIDQLLVMKNIKLK